jgi:glutathionyl-hydroquinone reductase
VILRAIRDSGAGGIGDFDRIIRQASQLGRSDEQQHKKRQSKSKLYQGLPCVFSHRRLIRRQAAPPIYAIA